MLRTNTPRGFMPLAFLFSLLGAGFTSWSAWGNAIDLCFTAGCTIYQDTTIAGISVWWLGTAGFALLALMAIIGRPRPALFVSGLALFCDCLLLLLLAFTAPCVACLIAGVFFALSYAAFRGAALKGQSSSRSKLLLLWFFLLVGNLLSVANSEMGTWPMKAVKDPAINFYFSPTCPACREGITALSGRSDVALYPVPRNESDVPLIHAMSEAFRRGATPAEALKRALEAPPPSGWELWSFGMLRLRFALFRNKAHALNAGGGALPFVEYLGLPPGLSGQAGRKPAPPADAKLPVHTEPGICVEGTACP